MKFIELDQSAIADDLTDACIKAFGRLSDETLVQMFLTIHPWYISSADLAKKLSNNYLISILFGSAPEMTILTSSCLSVLLTLSVDLNPELQGGEHQNTLINIDSVPSYEWRRQAQFDFKKRKTSLLFHHLDSSELAEHLSYMEHMSFCRIPVSVAVCLRRFLTLQFQDHHSFVMHGCTVDFITHFNSVSQWIQLMVLTASPPPPPPPRVRKRVNPQVRKRVNPQVRKRVNSQIAS
uniref:Uncharacterized protein n=1 Tax=Oncorhynchus kisutch TaxID=8019 RepID=A0A8C7K4E1_ONCKI